MNREQLPHGYFGPFGDNEVELVSTKDDPPKFRQESPGPGRSLGCFSFGRNGNEKVLVQGKLSEDGRSAEFGVWLYDESRPGSDDDKMGNPVLLVTPQGVQVNGQAIGGGGSPSHMTSPQGRFQTHQQEDGNFVTYDTHVQPWKAVWSAWTGLIR